MTSGSLVVCQKRESYSTSGKFRNSSRLLTHADPFIPRIMDEDRMDKDDRLGVVSIVLNDIGSSHWSDVTEQPFEIKKKHASKRANLMRAAATMMHPVRKALNHSKNHDDEHHAEELYISVEVLEKMTSDQDVGKAFTLGPCRWMQHYSPLIGRMVGTKEGSSDAEDDGGQRSIQGKANGKGGSKDDNKTERFE